MAMLININLILQLLLSQLLYTLWNIFHENERNFIIVMSVTKFPLIGWSIIKMIFNDLTFDKAQLCLPSNFMKAKYQKSSELEKDLILNQQTFTFSKKNYFVWHSKDLWALEKLIRVSRGTEAGLTFMERSL